MTDFEAFIKIMGYKPDSKAIHRHSNGVGGVVSVGTEFQAVVNPDRKDGEVEYVQVPHRIGSLWFYPDGKFETVNTLAGYMQLISSQEFNSFRDIERQLRQSRLLGDYFVHEFDTLDKLRRRNIKDGMP